MLSLNIISSIYKNGYGHKFRVSKILPFCELFYDF